MKRFIALMAAASLLMCAFCGCESKAQKERRELEELAKVLIAGGVDVCEDIYLGGGMEADVPDDVIPDYENGSYYPVMSEQYSTIKAMKSAAERIFTSDLVAYWLYPAAFDGDRPLYKEVDGVLYVDITNTDAPAFGTTWLYDTLTITQMGENYATLTIDTRLGDEKIETRTIELLRTAGGWRINTALIENAAHSSDELLPSPTDAA